MFLLWIKSIFAIHKGTIIFFYPDKLKKLLGSILKFFIPLLCGAALFWYLYSHLDMHQIGVILQSEINYFWIALSMIIGLMSHIFRALRWKLQLKTLGVDPSVKALTNAVFGMYAMNLLIPRVGEVWRCTYLARWEKMSFTQVLGSIISERLCDTLTLVFLTVITFFLQMKVSRDFLRKFPTIEETLWRMITTPWLYICLLVMVGFLIWLFTKKTENRWVAKVKSIVKNLWYGFRTILRMKQVTMFLLYTVAIWFCYFLELYVCFFAFGSMQHLGVLAAMTLFVMGSLSMGIPVQGGVGPWHLAIIAALSIYGIGENIAGAFALVAHGSQMLLIILLGIYTLFSVSLEKKKDRSAGLADFVGSRRENDNY